jgi:hypothetical protein
MLQLYSNFAILLREKIRAAAILRTMSNSKRNTHMMMKATLGATVITILFSLLTYVLFMSLQPFSFGQSQNATDNIQANKSEISILSRNKIREKRYRHYH